ncbi:MAG: NADH-quinone oxidoreductase subunit C [Lachnospiraceae bacterium]|nr:NADH-quinone oxidoreductase subunit C [Lachnospiraceae bacterium]
MAEVIHPEEQLLEIDVDQLLTKAMELKKAGFRLSQACAAYVNEKFELSYSFADDKTYQYTTLRVVIDTDTEVPSITDIVPPAVFYENEMKELFGVKIKMINLDYENRFYRIETETPFGPKEAAASEEKKEEA